MRRAAVAAARRHLACKVSSSLSVSFSMPMNSSPQPWADMLPAAAGPDTTPEPRFPLKINRIPGGYEAVTRAGQDPASIGPRRLSSLAESVVVNWSPPKLTSSTATA